ncbi:hypothetical protein AVEN_70869-1 [Araneus ventricosus]|uniref:Uncharacterized protein n=1 Tax=Araneus ventricosus TaxID=182803 RepID=A0A4Y2HR10_ARAVE|nr:hypothetical protein AVEN_70869-1 [Araneus ventricosus]
MTCRPMCCDWTGYSQFNWFSSKHNTNEGQYPRKVFQGRQPILICEEVSEGFETSSIIKKLLYLSTWRYFHLQNSPLAPRCRVTNVLATYGMCSGSPQLKTRQAPSALDIRDGYFIVFQFFRS